MKITAAACTETGRRPQNEDAYLVEPALGLFGVADGMGGYEGGEVAARLAVDAVRAFVAQNAADGEVTWPFGLDRALDLDENLVQAALRVAHREITTQRVGALAQMGSTFTSLLVRGGRAVIGQIGDSRLYRLRAGRVEQLTPEHSLYAELLAAGDPHLPPRSEFAYTNVITRALGMGGQANPDVVCAALEPGDTFLLATDGLDPVPPDTLAALLGQPPARACRALCDEALARGSRDNVTVVVVRVEP